MFWRRSLLSHSFSVFFMAVWKKETNDLCGVLSALLQFKRSGCCPLCFCSAQTNVQHPSRGPGESKVAHAARHLYLRNRSATPNKTHRERDQLSWTTALLLCDGTGGRTLLFSVFSVKYHDYFVSGCVGKRWSCISLKGGIQPCGEIISPPIPKDIWVYLTG